MAPPDIRHLSPGPTLPEEFKRAIRTSPPGAAVCYHRGEGIARDAIRVRGLAETARLARAYAEEGLCALHMRRDAASGVFLHLAVIRPRRRPFHVKPGSGAPR